MIKFRVYGLTCVLLLAASFAHATTIVLPTDEQLVAKAPLIVEGTVLSSTPVERDGSVWTETVVSVARNVKGQTPETITVREPGGIVGDRITRIFGTPEFADGERVLLFLEPSPRGGYRTVDLFVGKFEEARMLDGRRLWLRDDFAHDVTLLDADFRPLEAKNVQREAEGFESFVEARLSGQQGRKNYGIENPVLARDFVTGGSRLDVRANFTLIDEPTVYRWFRFANGQAAQWYSSGTQPGYTNGGVSELRTGMDSWTGYSAARILYSYVGTRSGSLGGLSNPNGVNEVLLNDPLNEVSGTWNKSTGGVVGQGGFNGVSSQQTFTATFAADTAHPAGQIKAWNITEGNLTIQDNVSPSQGISSARLAEILAHEFGHTLGFGHSADSTALMYYSVTGFGPALRGDDQMAARWLYPNGTGGGTDPQPAPTPAGPSNLAATASGSSIQLSWTDNANNETGQAVYVNDQKVADLAANVVSTTLNGYTPGTYAVYVIATNSSGISPKSNEVSVTVATPTLSASFTMTPDSATVGQRVQFNSTSTGATSLQWDFGDGVTTTGQYVTHGYAAAGQYTIVLTAKANGATSYARKTVQISGPLAPSFVYTPTAPVAGDTVSFTDQSTGGPASWSWTFGDGTSSTEQNPSKRFGSAGNYTVTLTIGRGTATASGQRVITVAPSSSTVPVTPSVAAAFDLSASAVTPGTNVVFTDRSTGAPTHWQWSFGDGAISTSQHAVHAYAGPGTYTVTLTASNATTSSFATKQVTVSSLAAYRTLVSAAAQTAGAGGTAWRTELNIFNAGAQSADVTMLFIPNGGGSPISRSLFLGPKQLRTYSNALLDIFGIANGAGAIALEASSPGITADLRVTSRTFTAGETGTYGQAIPDVTPDALERTLYVTGMTVTSAYRTNVGLVNREAAPVSATLTLLNNIGTTLATKTVTLAANSFQQQALSAYFPVIEGGSYDVLTMRVSSASQNAVSAYASVIDNRTQDPIYLQAVPAATGGALTVPVVGRSPGANGTFWRSDVTLYNPSSSTVSLTVRFNNQSQTVSLGGNDTEVLADVLSRFGLASGTGTLRVSWTSGTGPVVMSRTYTTVANGGTYGQSIDPVEAFGRTMYVPGLRNDGSYRSNVGFVNGGTEQEIVNVTLLSSFGTQLATTTVSIAPNAQAQYGVTALFPNADVSAGFTLHVEGDANAQVFAYGSMVDNASGDPVFFGGR